MNRPTRPPADKAGCCREVEPIHAGSPQGLIIVTCVYADDRPDCQRGRRAVTRRDRPEQATLEKVKLRPSVPFLRPEIGEGSITLRNSVGLQETIRR